LRDDDHTVRLFQLLHRRYPELAGQCYAVAEQALVDGGEYATCVSYLADLEQRFAAIRQS
jgi:hypothetical protein